MSAARRSIVPPSFDYWLARLAGFARPRRPERAAPPARPSEPGISVVIPSRNGRELLAAQFPGLLSDLEGFAAEVIVADNGSDDGTAAWLGGVARETRIAIIADVSTQPLSFARAVNRGIARARYSHICLLNNDMLIEPGFFTALRRAFDQAPGLFCATAQIRFPEGVRREETGKAVMGECGPADFPLRCDEPLAGEDGTPVLYGSGGCSLYDAGKLRALGTLDEAYEPAYVEDLDLGYRAWQRAWPSVYVAGAVVEHRHRATTRRYYSEEQLEGVLEINYLRFLARAVADRGVFARLWKQAIGRLRLLEKRPAARNALGRGWALARGGGPRTPVEWPEESFLALTSGCVATFPGSGPGAAVVHASACLEAPSPEMLRAHREVAVVAGARESPAFQAALRFGKWKWRGEVAPSS
jgi:GT2 family glycosyltransferase